MSAADLCRKYGISDAIQGLRSTTLKSPAEDDFSIFQYDKKIIFEFFNFVPPTQSCHKWARDRQIQL